MPGSEELVRLDGGSGSDGIVAISASRHHQTITVNDQIGLRLHFNNVSYVNKRNSSSPILILNDACGEFRTGRLTAILGPSGSGKTSMLNVLSGFKATGVTGKFDLNGQKRQLAAFRKMSSYIPQDFAMLDLLTVEETLKVSTDLKLPKETGPKEKTQIIDHILQLLNMDRCRKTLVQNLSGGERKRLSIGIELVTNPPIMFFDEPTSGLDSVASLQVISYLKRLAHDGRIIVCVVHQPSSRLMKLFDDVLVMSRGQVLYAGPQDVMIERFEAAGFLCPNYYNPADFVLEVASDTENKNVLQLIQRNRELYSDSSKMEQNPDETTELLKNGCLQTSIEMPNGTPSEPQAIGEQTCCQPDANIRPKEQVSVWRQFSILVVRALRSMSRNLLAVQMRILMHIIVGVLLGIVFWDIGNDGAKVLSNASCIFFVVMFIFFGNAMPSILLCPQDTAVFLREYLNGWYSVRAYYLAKIISNLPMQFICPTLLMSIVYWMTSQPAQIDRFLMCWIISLLTAAIGHFIGLVFGSLFEMQMAIFLVPGFTIPVMIFSGFFIRINEVASFLRPLCDISFFRYTIEGQLRALYGYNRPDLECHVNFCYFKSPRKFLKEFDMLGDHYGTDICALIVWIIVLEVLFYLSLMLRIRKAQ